MPTFRKLAIFVVATLALMEGPISSDAQSAPAAKQPNSISVHISLQKSGYSIGEKPIVVMTIKNISSNEVWFSTASNLYRIHATNKDDEPPKTEFDRHLLGDFRPGDSTIGLRGGSVASRPIEPGSLDKQSYNLSYFYDISKLGDYSVYLEIYDPAGPKDGSGNWLRTNTATFAIQTP